MRIDKDNTRTWICNYCKKEEMQEGGRALTMPPVPPIGWAEVSITKFVPSHKDAGGNKIGDALDDVRKSLCPSCQDKIKDLMETGAYG